MNTSRNWVSGYPKLVAEWHPTKNGELTPDRVTYGSSRRVWWKCARGVDHEWRASPNSRTANRTGCPFCANVAVSVTNSLASIAPDLAVEWDAEKNGKGAERVVAYSARPAWWRCPVADDHVWMTSPNQRVSRGTGCPFCAGRRVSRTNSLAAVAPEIAREWHPTRNRIAPTDVVAGAQKRVWWRCRRRHVWMASIANRTINGSRCPVCARESAHRAPM